MSIKFKSLLLIGLSSFLLLGGCVDKSKGLAEAEAAESTYTLRLAHNQGVEHPVHISLENFGQAIEQKSNDTLEVQVYPTGQLGQERDVVELVQSGVVDFSKVSASALEGFDERYSIFSLPYVFHSKEHFYDVMDNSSAVHEIFNASANQGFIAIGWYDAGNRNIYTVDKKVERPADLNGMKIRVQESSTSINMIKAMGGSPTPMAYGEVYTSLQAEIIDGAENNITALTVNRHGEVAKAHSYTEHQYAPDILIISTKTWNNLSENQKEIVMDSVKETSENHKKLWDETEISEKKAAEEMGVKFYTIDKSEFIESVKPLHEAFKNKSDEFRNYFEDFQSYLK